MEIRLYIGRTLNQIADIVMADFRQAEKTRALWLNPLSVYSPDPLKLAVVMFNCSRAEQIRETKKKVDKLKLQVGALRKGKL